MDKIKIGKNVIENLTIGMYQDSKIIFREYIQNSADQIDKAMEMGLFIYDDLQIEIDIDTNKRNIQIKDNATGIKAEDVRGYLANIADSEKDRDKDKGFRGIGRLGGLAYCDTLKFITSYKGEDIKTTMTWDAKLCRELISDKSVNDDAEEIVRKVISFTSCPCDVEEHFFIVDLGNIRHENSELLDVEQVVQYISSNVPVPYNNKFIFNSKIYDYIKEHNLKIDEYKIYVNGIDILKNYSTNLYEKGQGSKKKYDEIHDVEFKQFISNNGDLIAWMWFGISGFIRQIPEVNEMRGIRLRKANIQVGNGNTLVPLFKEQRGNFYFIGEVHAIHNDLIPNARRDYFNENEIRNEFEANLRYFFENHLTKLYYNANKVKNLYKREVELIKHESVLKQKQRDGFISKEEEEVIVNKVEEAKKVNQKAKKELEKIKENKVKDDETFKHVIDVIEKKHKSTLDELKNSNEVVIDHNDDDNNNHSGKKNKVRYISEKLHKLDNKQRKLVSKIYKVIKETLPEEISENLIKKINNELSK